MKNSARQHCEEHVDYLKKLGRPDCTNLSDLHAIPEPEDPLHDASYQTIADAMEKYTYNSAKLATVRRAFKRIPGQSEPSIQELDANDTLNVTLHAAGGVSFDRKGPLIFYSDPKDPGVPNQSKEGRPKQYKYEMDEDYKQGFIEWEACQPHRLEPEDLLYQR